MSERASLREFRRLRRFVGMAVKIEAAVAFASWDIWGALALGHSGVANARTAGAICVVGLLFAVGGGLLHAFEDKL